MVQAAKNSREAVLSEMDKNLVQDRAAELGEERYALLKGIPQETIRNAWFTLSHLLLADGAHVIDMGSDDGSMTFAMSVLNPNIKITGIDKNKRQINKAKELYKRHNLDFVVGDVTGYMLEKNSFDAIINSFVLHEVYSISRYNRRAVVDTMQEQFKLLKPGGTMFIRDYASPPPEEMVVIEMPDVPSLGESITDMSEPDLLIWYSEHARPRSDPGTGGFFLEELPARFPRTRLFRLPHKWAYEFLLRKDDRKKWETELQVEYTFYTDHDFRRQLRTLGARLQYSAPYWDEEFTKKHFEGRFRLYSDSGRLLGSPPTSYIAVAQKMSERKSLHIEERRPSLRQKESTIKISSMRNDKTGEIADIVSRNMEIGEILPYLITEDGRLKIFLHDGVARSVVNAMPRSGYNIDGKRWSGHMLEPVSFDMAAIADIGAFDVKNTALFARDHLGLKPSGNAVLEHGMDYYPSPDYIDERIRSYFLRVESTQREILPKTALGYNARFQARGVIREIEAQHVLNAIAVGLVPNGRLEMQILSLYQHLGLKAENWTQKDIALKRGKITAKADIRVLLQSIKGKDNRFQSVKGATGQIRNVHSIFVEEGQSQGAITGLSAQDVDFVIADGKTVNTVVIIPLTANEQGDVHAGFLVKHLPVPQRHEGNGMTISAPSYDLPPDVRNLEDAKRFIAEKFGVAPEMVFKMGESYFSHTSLTPQRIHPFAISVPPGTPPVPGSQFIPIRWFIMLWHSLGREPHFMLTLARSYRYLHGSLQLDAKIKAKMILEERFASAQQDWSIPYSYAPVPQFVEEEPEQNSDMKAAPVAVETPSAPKAVEEPPQPEEAIAEELEKEIVEIVQVIKEELPDEYSPRPSIK